MRPCIGRPDGTPCPTGALTTRPGARCPDCTPPRAPRPGARSRGYTRTWERTRRRWLTAHPTCAACGQPATDVDHIIPLARFANRQAADHPDNLQALCHPCHSRKTNLHDGGLGRPPEPVDNQRDDPNRAGEPTGREG